MHFNHYQIQEAMVSVKDRFLSFKVFSYCAFSCLKQLLIWSGCRESFIWLVLWVIFFFFYVYILAMPLLNFSMLRQRHRLEKHMANTNR